MKKSLTLFILLLTTQLWSQYRPNNGVTVSKANVILIKNVSASENWIMYHVGLGGNTKNLYLDATNAVDTRTDTFNSTSPTSSLFTVF